MIHLAFLVSSRLVISGTRARPLCRKYWKRSHAGTALCRIQVRAALQSLGVQYMYHMYSNMPQFTYCMLSTTRRSHRSQEISVFNRPKALRSTMPRRRRETTTFRTISIWERRSPSLSCTRPRLKQRLLDALTTLNQPPTALLRSSAALETQRRATFVKSNGRVCESCSYKRLKITADH
ncbi:hypothetical protein DFJ77DRAFT_50996 [Powellomyces hirtus]|nr:hypothetical protein DFJ77DRAFT_50996 [Powellomyces hirtus]